MKVSRNPEVLWREEDESKAEAYAGLSQGDNVADVGTSVLFADGVMLSLNVLGTEVWKRCDGRTLDDMIADLASQFDVEPAVLLADVMEFLTELEKKGFVSYDNS
jgi:pyrroloquinoline quinone biosynthesis protein D